MEKPDPDQDDVAPSQPVGLAETAEARLSAAEDAIAIGAFRLIERFLLLLVALLTLGAVGVELNRVYLNATINLSDLLLMFLYTEVIGMIAVFYTGRGSPFVYPIFIAITALARLIVLQGKEMAPQNMLFEAAAIVLLSLSVVILMRAAKG
jgi:protein PsiE